MASGDLDTSFDGNGMKAISFGGTDVAHVVLARPDGRIVVAGNVGGSATMTVMRLRSDGSPDTTFDGDGTATIDVGSGADTASDVVLQPDGRIVVAGSMAAVAGDFAVARLLG